jgi:hypothetical protein
MRTGQRAKPSELRLRRNNETDAVIRVLQSLRARLAASGPPALAEGLENYATWAQTIIAAELARRAQRGAAPPAPRAPASPKPAAPRPSLEAERIRANLFSLAQELAQ